MSAAANVPDPPIQPSRSASLLGLVRKLIDYGRELAATIRRRALTDAAYVRRCFGTADAALILVRIARGLQRAGALEARLLRDADRLDAPPPATAFRPMPRAPRAAAGEADIRLAHLPTPAQIAAKIRRQPIGAAIADICRDLGILPSHGLWRELQRVIINEGGNFARLVRHILDQTFPIPATAPPGPARASPGRAARRTAPACTGPP